MPAAKESALRAKLQAVRVKPVAFDIDIDRDAERMVAKAGAPATAIDFAPGFADAVTHQRTDLEASGDGIDEDLPNSNRQRLAHAHWLKSCNLDPALVLFAYGATGGDVYFARVQISIGFTHADKILRLLSQGIPLITLVAASLRQRRQMITQDQRWQQTIPA